MELAAPLYELATKGTDFEWTGRRNEAEERPDQCADTWVSPRRGVVVP